MQGPGGAKSSRPQVGGAEGGHERRQLRPSHRPARGCGRRPAAQPPPSMTSPGTRRPAASPARPRRGVVDPDDSARAAGSSQASSVSLWQPVMAERRHPGRGWCPLAGGVVRVVAVHHGVAGWARQARVPRQGPTSTRTRAHGQARARPVTPPQSSVAPSWSTNSAMRPCGLPTMCSVSSSSGRGGPLVGRRRRPGLTDLMQVESEPVRHDGDISTGHRVRQQHVDQRP